MENILFHVYKSAKFRKYKNEFNSSMFNDRKSTQKAGRKFFRLILHHKVFLVFLQKKFSYCIPAPAFW